MYGISTYMKNGKSTKFRQVYKSHDSYAYILHLFQPLKLSYDH